MEKDYRGWIPMIMFSNNGDEVILKGDYFVCVYTEPTLDNRWTYMVQLPDTNIVYPGAKDNQLSWGSKTEAKSSVDKWDDNTFDALQKLDDTTEFSDKSVIDASIKSHDAAWEYRVSKGL